MIIVSQDKRHIVNFSNIKEIRINNYNSLMADIYSDYELQLGIYKTEERAKEVLQEIVSLYKKCEYECGQISYIVVNKPKVYEIPKE